MSEKNEEILEEVLEEQEVADSEANETDESSGSDETIEVEAELVDEEQESEKVLIKAEADLKEANDRYQRTMAEFDNFRKRTLKEKTQMFESGSKEVLEKLLPIVDNFERAIEHISEEEKDLAITKGVEMIYKQLMGALSELGVEEIEAKGQEFDPNLHHAVSHEDNEDYDDNMVQEVFQKGYTFKNGVLRHSMVKVVN